MRKFLFRFLDWLDDRQLRKIVKERVAADTGCITIDELAKSLGISDAEMEEMRQRNDRTLGNA